MAFSQLPNVGLPGRLAIPNMTVGVDADIPTYTHNGSNVRYVSPTGNDAAAGTTSGAPLLTLAAALTALSATGGLVILDAGTYTLPAAPSFYSANSTTTWVVGDRTSGAVVINCASTTMTINGSNSGNRRTANYSFRYVDFINIDGLSNWQSNQNGVTTFVDCSLTFTTGRSANVFNGAWINSINFISCTITNAIFSTLLTPTGSLPSNVPTVINDYNAGFRAYNTRFVNCSYQGNGFTLANVVGTFPRLISGGFSALRNCVLHDSRLPFTGLSLVLPNNPSPSHNSASMFGVTCTGKTDGTCGIVLVLLNKVFMANDSYDLLYSSGANRTAVQLITFGPDNTPEQPTVKALGSFMQYLSDRTDVHPLHPNRTNATNTLVNTTAADAANTYGYANRPVYPHTAFTSVLASTRLPNQRADKFAEVIQANFV